MNINPVFNNAPGINISGQAGLVGLTNLAEGDSITARVIFSGDGTAHLKTAEGGLIRARLDGNITLPEGSQVTMTITEKTAESITLRIAEASGTGSNTANSAAEKPSPLPPALAAVFEQIQSANIAPEAKVALFTKALADFPNLNNQSPAVQAALASLTGQTSGQPTAPVGLGQMLVELAVLISNLENAGSGSTTQQATAQQATSAGQAQANPNPAAPTVQATIITEAHLPGSQPAATPAAAPANPGANLAATANAAAETPLPAQAVSTNAGTPAANVATANAAATTPTEQAANTSQSTIAAAQANTQAATTTTQNTNTAAPTTPVADGTAQTNRADASPAPATAQPNTQAAPTTTPTPAPPAEALQTVRHMIGELYPPGSSEPSPKALSQFIERLFAQVGRTVEQGGEQLQKCARELEVRLNLLKEAISQSSLPQREELLSQTNRILQQTETLREARLLCMQLPIQFENQKQTAELYVFRRQRKAGQKLDAQNATVLLALNTEHLGRLEALIQTRGKEINLKLEISKEEAVPLVREYSQALPRLLQEAGFKLNSSSIGHLQRERNNPQAAEKALIEYQRNFDGKLDFFI